VQMPEPSLPAESIAPATKKPYNDCDPFADGFEDDPFSTWKPSDQKSEGCWSDNIADKEYAAPPTKKKLAFFKETTTH